VVCSEDNEVAEPMDRSLVAGDEVGGVGPGVVVDRVGEVVGEVLERALLGDDGLDEVYEN